jgi:hypothetical protein
MRTTVNINDALLKELKARAAESGTPFRQILEETLRLGLAAGRGGHSPSKFRVKPHPLGLHAGLQGTSLNQLYDQLEAEDLRRLERPGNEQTARVAEESP